MARENWHNLVWSIHGCSSIVNTVVTRYMLQYVSTCLPNE